MYRLFAAVFCLSILAAGPALFAQNRGPVPRLDFDVRDTLLRFDESANAAAAKQAQARVEQALAGSRTAEGGEIVYSAGRFGLPGYVGARGGALSPASAGDDETIARRFLADRTDWFPLTVAERNGLRLVFETTAGELHVLRFERTLAGAPVYDGGLAVVIDSLGRVVQVNSEDAPGGVYVSPDEPVLGAPDAVAAAYAALGGRSGGEVEPAPAGADGRLRFQLKDHPELAPASVEFVRFPLEDGEARPAWRIWLELPANGYEAAIDAASGSLLKATALGRDFGAARAWRREPGPPRETVAFPAGWLAASQQAVTNGQNADVFVDLDADGEPDPLRGAGLLDGRAQADAGGLFDHPSGTGDDVTPANRAASATQAFYFVNLAHDYFYELGFQEREGAMQRDNGTRGGLGGDPVRVGVHDTGLLFNASFVPTPDGQSPRMRLGLVPVGARLRDSAYSGDVVVHEYAHGVTERLAGGPANVECIGFDPQPNALAEAWSDYFAASFFDSPAVAPYLSEDPARGIRRSALDRVTRHFGDLGDPYFQRHNDGEIFSGVLWRIRAALGPQVADKLILDSLKILPCDTTFVSARDAMLTVDRGANRERLWTIFAEAGLGHSARAFNVRGGVDSLFDAAFDLPPEVRPNQNRPPRFLSFPNEISLQGEEYRYTARVEDPDGDAVTLRLVAGPPDAQFNAATGQLVYRGQFSRQRVVIEARDARGARSLHGLLIFSGAAMTAGRPIAIAGDPFSRGVGVILVNQIRANLQATLRGGTGDPDLTLVSPTGQIFLSSNIGSFETLTVPEPVLGFWFIFVDAFSAYNNVILTANLIRPDDLTTDVRRPGLAGQRTSETLLRIPVPAGTPRLRVTTFGGTGDIDILLARGRVPVCRLVLGLTFCDSDHQSDNDGNNETIEIAAPQAGDWFLTLRGHDSYANTTLVVATSASTIRTTGATDAAAFSADVASGGIATLFGEGLAESTVEATTLPLPREMGGAAVFVNGVPAPLFYVSPRQINFQMPVAAGVGAKQIVARRGEMVSNTAPAAVQGQAPRLFSFRLADGSLAPVVIHADGAVVTPENRAKAGEILVAFLTGAAIDPTPPDGVAAGANPLSLTVTPAEVTVDGAPAATLFSGAAPGFEGLIQVNFQLPAVLPPGGRLNLILQFADASTAVLPLYVAQ